MSIFIQHGVAEETQSLHLNYSFSYDSYSEFVRNDIVAQQRLSVIGTIYDSNIMKLKNIKISALCTIHERPKRCFLLVCILTELRHDKKDQWLVY